ncbi:MetQ/NlpA family ABC transporter substrate-binding protein [uncultured Salinicola sp.]|uniref:MetQ/NlpA family ABC transporter substrate-binding protein n=1 Tax=uncultured Salinicola sp. TaxID=1193542 RepID=UPI002639A9B0|nr:MetQ/NlpA family ABC transporter substrate-binding protein [uncultured Salinicola sp.]
MQQLFFGHRLGLGRAPVRYLIASLAALTVLLATQAHADPLKVGVVSNGLIVDSVHEAADLAKAEGLDVEVIEFSDWVLPNTALANGDIDINYFQHEPFLDNAEKSQGFDLVPLAYGVEGLMGLYSKTANRIDDIAPGSTIAIADDPVNQGRGLLLLQQAGLITLPADIGYHATVYDIVDNPRQLDFVELPGPQLARAYQDADAVISYPHYIKASGVTNPADALIFHHDDTHAFALRFVVRPDSVENPRVRQFIRLYQRAPEVRASLHQAFGDDTLYRLAWLDAGGIEDRGNVASGVTP